MDIIKNFEVGMKFVGNVNRAKMEIVKIEKGQARIKDLKTGKTFSCGLQALRHCNITII